GVRRRGLAGEHENAGADDGSDAQQRQVPCAEHAFQRMLALGGSFFLEHRNALRRPQAHAVSPLGTYTKRGDAESRPNCIQARKFDSRYWSVKRVMSREAREAPAAQARASSLPPPDYPL